jgi:hypothetical protein
VVAMDIVVGQFGPLALALMAPWRLSTTRAFMPVLRDGPTALLGPSKASAYNDYENWGRTERCATRKFFLCLSCEKSFPKALSCVRNVRKSGCAPSQGGDGRAHGVRDPAFLTTICRYGGRVMSDNEDALIMLAQISAAQR